MVVPDLIKPRVDYLFSKANVEVDATIMGLHEIEERIAILFIPQTGRPSGEIIKVKPKCLTHPFFENFIAL